MGHLGYAYAKMEREDPEEAAHRRAQWLIARVMEEADARRRKASLRVRICRLKIRMGRRLKRLRHLQLSFSAARRCLTRRVAEQLKVRKWVLKGKEAAVTSLPPLFG